MKRTLLLILLTGFLSCSLAGAVRVTRARITLGSSFKLPARATAELEFEVENPDPAPCRVMIRLRQSESFMPSGNNNSPEVYVPAKSKVVYNVPIHLDNAEKYRYEVFVNGIKQSSSVLQDCMVRLAAVQDYAIGLLNDLSEDTDGFYFQSRNSRSSIYHIRSGKAPRRKELYDTLRLLIYARPEAGKLSSEQYSAILEYAASGGTILFTDPRGILEAAKTPLKVLLPVEAMDVRKVTDRDYFRIFPGIKAPVLPRDGVDFLCSIPRADKKATVILRAGGMPLLTQMRYGQGTVKVLSVLLNKKNFINAESFISKIRSEALFTPDTEKLHNDFSSVLNMLTGFAVPDTGLIRNILLIYLLLLAGILFWGFRKKRTGQAWALCVLCAVCGTLLILLYARLTIGRRGSLAAVISLQDNTLSAGTDDYMALYSRKAASAKLKPDEPLRNILSVIPYHRILGVMKQDPHAPVLDLHYRRDDTMEIRSLHLPVRTSRQLLSKTGPDTLPLEDEKDPPLLILDEEGMKLRPWKIPGNKEVESAFMVFPGSSRLLNVDSDRICTLGDAREFITDPLLRELRRALEKSTARNYPLLVTLSPLTAKERSSAGKLLEKGKFILQGKVLQLYGADLQIRPRSIFTIPGAMLLPARCDQSGRMLLSGNRLRIDHEFQAGHDIQINFMNPAIPQSLEILQASLELTLSSGSSDVELIPSLTTASGVTVKGKKESHGKYIFSFPEGRKPTGRLQYITLHLKSSPAIRQKISPDLKISCWSILSMDLSLRCRAIAAAGEK